MESVVQHPSTGRLAAFLTGRLDNDDEQAWIEEHLEKCEQCGEAFNLLSQDDSLLLRLRDHLDKEARAQQEISSSVPSAVCREESQDTEALSGTTLGKYEITEIIGRGGMGVVYKARDSVILRDVAFKVLPSAISQDKDMMERLLAEARHAGAIANPHVVTVFDMASESGIGFVAMEYVSGGNVADLLKRNGRLKWEEATRLLKQACIGVAAAHSHGLTHRDIKPGNLLLTNDGQVKVADFGLSKGAERDHTQSAAGSITGTAHFMSPEQCRGEVVDSRSDIYSLGATYFNLLTGKTPYSEMKQTPQILYAHCHAKAPYASKLHAEIPESCSSVIARCMAKSPDQRYQDCGRLVDDLSAILEGSSLKSSGSVWRSLTAMPSGPSLIVLPFQNLSSDPEQEYFSDGITHEIITQLGRFRELHLIAGNTAFQYKGPAVDIRKLGEELGVQYAVEGTVRHAGKRLRVSATLLDTQSRTTLWTDSFDKDFSPDDIFEIQDKIAEQVTSALAQPHGQLQMVERTRRQALGGLDAYDAVLRFYEYWHEESFELYQSSRELLVEAVRTNPSYAHAAAALALVYVNGFRIHDVESSQTDMTLAYDLAKRALAVDPHCEMAHEAIMSVYFHRGETRAFSKTAEDALLSHPNHADLLADAGVFFTCLGKYSRGVALAKKALALSPRPPDWYHAAELLEAFHDENYEEALSQAFKFAQPQFWSNVHRAVAFGHLGRESEGAAEIEKATALFPSLATHFRSVLSRWHLSDGLENCYIDGVRKAGLEIE